MSWLSGWSSSLFAWVGANKKPHFVDGPELADSFVAASDQTTQAAASSSNKNEKPTIHSVVCIGYYRGDDQKYWYLMKKSWENMPLFLASATYLEACGANAFFISQLLTEGALSSYKKHTSNFTQCALPPIWKGYPKQPKCNGLQCDDGFMCGANAFFISQPLTERGL